jgi:anti-anti-sigma factor
MSFAHVRTIAGVPVASLLADVDSANAAEVLQELTREISNEPAGLVVDLSETRYVDSAGIEMLFQLREKLANRRQRLAVVVAAGSQLRRLLELTGVDKAVTLTDEVPAAVSAVTEGGKQSTPVDP